MPAICQGGTSAALGGSWGLDATSAIWSDGGAGGSFNNNGGITPALATYTASATSGPKVTLTLTAHGGSCEGVSDFKVITVNPTLPVSVSISANPLGPICAGTSVTFTAAPVNGGTPTYQWKVNSLNVGTNSPTYTSTTLSNNDVVKVVMTSSLTCVTGSPATSNSITMSVNTALPVSVSISSNPLGPICAGTSVTFHQLRSMEERPFTNGKLTV